ncbi:hypothetical protein ACGF7U_31475 [Micromonospora sp. NPDC047670]|uniref:hypothetical protein n=1 Tax=Micromonospora sp. NPDC047670 TaxID=3364252 RepID=UPI00371E9E71
MLRTYGKAWAALAIALLTALAAALTDNRLTAPEGVQIAIAVTTAGGVWLVPIVPQWPWVKTGIAMLLAVLNLAVTLITDGITFAEAVNLALAGLGVLGIAAAPAHSLYGARRGGSR